MDPCGTRLVEVTDGGDAGTARVMELRALRVGDEVPAERAHAELEREGFPFLISRRPETPWREYLEDLERERVGVDVAEGRVPCTFLVAVVDGAIVGRLSVRHRLNERLAVVGGHIGYAVLPAARRRGYATGMMRAGLALLAEMGIAEALVTCDDDNIASARVIERAGGRLQDTVDGIRRYWVSTTA